MKYMQEREISNFKIMFEDEARAGYDYLNERLDRDEAGVFFRFAHEHGSAPFQDYDRRKYTLTYKDNFYVLDRK